MLELALRYKDQLDARLQSIAFDDRFKFLNPNDRAEYFENLDKSSIDRLQFVSVYQDEVIGYLDATINRQVNTISGLGIVNFTGKPNKVFSMDFARFFIDLFEKFSFNKIVFGVVIGNPAEEIYDRFIEKHGGRIVGTFLQEVRCWDGKIYDWKLYEIFRSEFLRQNPKRLGF